MTDHRILKTTLSDNVTEITEMDCGSRGKEFESSVGLVIHVNETDFGSGEGWGKRKLLL